ncbi:MAG: nuclear transport factor 2 family protein, partial [Cucumibacter sp.]
MPKSEATISEAEIVAWLERYKRAWEQRDADLAAAIFTPGATYREQPFETPVRGREGVRQYWLENVVENQRDIHFEHELWAVRDKLAFIHWRAHFTWLPINGVMELDGTWRLAFEPGED